MNVEKRFQKKFREKKEKSYKKFTGNREEGQGFADKRKKKIEHEYRKLLRKEKRSDNDRRKHVSVLEELSDEATGSTDVTEAKQRSIQKPIGTYTKAHHEYKQRKKEKERKKKEALKKKQSIDTAMEKYNKKKQSDYKLLCKRTSRGQPVMKHQIEYLLEKIKKQKT
ncbi:thyroid transcription factor 1-associated protein 26-like [Ostrea edulis]|uniref:thyroid transcription factor 1-associated protein 26-like n=1 Tax=Ostrea edulis TaxID=37623 RepID=UPI002094F824|nr:thyroid transcription factor 1-associated protein 26-like [Ostrea edulis]